MVLLSLGAACCSVHAAHPNGAPPPELSPGGGFLPVSKLRGDARPIRVADTEHPRQIEEPPALRLGDGVVGAHQLLRFPVGQDIPASLAVFRRLAVQPLEEEGDRHLKRDGNGPETAGAYAVRSRLVFLQLLELDADQIGEPLAFSRVREAAAQSHRAGRLTAFRILSPVGDMTLSRGTGYGRAESAKRLSWSAAGAALVALRNSLQFG